MSRRSTAWLNRLCALGVAAGLSLAAPTASAQLADARLIDEFSGLGRQTAAAIEDWLARAEILGVMAGDLVGTIHAGPTLDEARAALARGLEGDPDPVIAGRAMRAVGLAAVEIGDTLAATGVLERYQSAAPGVTSPATAAAIVELLVALGRVEEAQTFTRDLTRSLQGQGTTIPAEALAEVHLRGAKAMARHGASAAALEALSEAATIGDYPEGRRLQELAQINLLLGNPREAEDQIAAIRDRVTRACGYAKLAATGDVAVDQRERRAEWLTFAERDCISELPSMLETAAALADADLALRLINLRASQLSPFPRMISERLVIEAMSRAGRQADAVNRLREARDVAAEIGRSGNAQSIARAQGVLAVASAAAGEARDGIRILENESRGGLNTDPFLADMASALARIGNVDDARDVARSIRTPEIRAAAYRNILFAVLDVGG